MADEIINIIGEGAFKQIDELIKRIEDAKTAIVDLNKAAQNVNVGGGSGGSSGGGGGSKSSNLREIERLNEALLKQAELIDDLTKEVNKQITVNEKDKRTIDERTAAQGRARKALVELGKLEDELSRAKKKAISANSTEKKALQVQIDLLEKAAKAQKEHVNSVNETSSAWEAMVRQSRILGDKVRVLGANYISLQMSQNASASEIKAAGQAFRDASKKAIMYSRAIKEVEMAAGQSNKGFSDYNELLAQTNFIMQELPNFAISARTGILSLSNNIPQFTAAFSRAMREVDEGTGKVRGFGGALKQMGKTIFSWQTLIIAAVGILVAYNKEIGQFLTNLFTGFNAGRQAADGYREALKEAKQEAANSIVELQKLSTVLTNERANRIDVAKAIKDVREQYPEYLGFITEENRLTDEVSEAIQKQIALIGERSMSQAAFNALSKETETLIDRQNKLSDALRGSYKWYNRITLSYDRDIGLWLRLRNQTEMITKAVKELVKQQQVVAEQRKIAADVEQYNIDLNKKALDVIGDSIQGISKYKDTFTQLMDEYRKSGKTLEDYISGLKGVSEEQREHIKFLIEDIEDLKRAQQSLNGQTLKTNLEIAIDEAKRAADDKKRTGQSLKNIEERTVAALEYQKKIKDIKDKTRQEIIDGLVVDERDAAEHKHYLNEMANAHNEFLNAIYENEKKSRSRQKNNPTIDFSDPDGDALRRLNLSRIERQKEANKRLADDENLSLSERLAAFDSYAQERLLIDNKSNADEIFLIQTKLDKIAQIENKSESSRTENEKKLLGEKFALQTDLKRIDEVFASKQLEMERITNEERLKLIESYINQQQDLNIRGVQENVLAIRKESNTEIAELNKKYRNQEISYRAYRERLNKITSDTNAKLFDVQVDMYDQVLTNLKNQLSEADDAVQTIIRSIIKNVETERDKLRAPAEKRATQSVLELLGFGFKDKELSDEEVNKQIANQIQSLYNTIFSSIDEARRNYYEKRMSFLDMEREKISENAQYEKDSINSSLMSATKKEKALKRIDAETAAREKANDKQRRALQREQAIRDKNDAMFKIGLDGAIAVTKAISQAAGNPLMYWLIPLITAQVAAQLAAVSSRPIPQYAEGTDNHKGGLAIVGEAGQELIKTPSGQSFLTPNAATLVNLPKGTQVVPNHELYDTANKRALSKVSKLEKINEWDWAKATIHGFSGVVRRIEKAIQNKQENVFILKNGEWRKGFKKSGNWNRYISEA